MGQFSWLDCVTGKPILDDVERTSYVLVPQEFGGGHIEEDCYDGYGNFDFYDIYELVAEWNKEYIPEYIAEMQAGNWKCRFGSRDIEDFENYYNDKPIRTELRELGIILSCYDEDNERLQYPIKITYDPDAVYEECEPSKSDPNQGWGAPDSADMFFSFDALLTEQSPKIKRKDIINAINRIMSPLVDEPFEIIVRDYKQLAQDRGEDFYDKSEFNIIYNCTLHDEDDVEYAADQVYAALEGLGYKMTNVYWDNN